MSIIETLLRTAWEAGYESASSDVPKDREFESFMERFIEEITGPEPKLQAEESASDDLKKQIAWLRRDVKTLKRKLHRVEVKTLDV